MISKDTQIKLMEMAKSRFPNSQILPCGNNANFEKCFTVLEGKFIFWFNTSNDHSTRAVELDIH